MPKLRFPAKGLVGQIYIHVKKTRYKLKRGYGSKGLPEDLLQVRLMEEIPNNHRLDV